MRITSNSGLKINSDTNNSTTQDNVSVRYNGTAGSHKSGYLFRDKNDAINAAVKNDLQDDSSNFSSHLGLYTSTSGTLTKQMSINRYGTTQIHNQPSFRAYTTTDFTTNIVFEGSNWAEHHDNQNNFSNGRFVAPVDGVYLFTCMWDSNNSKGGINLLVNASSYYVKWEPTGVLGDAWESRSWSTTIKLSANDYVRVVGAHASGANPFHMGGGHWGHFSGHLLG